MRIHSDIIAPMHVIHALQAEHAAGRIARSVQLKANMPSRSKARLNSIEVQLYSSERVPGDGRRAGSSGSYTIGQSGDDFAATYDEWGWLLSALFAVDPEMVVGRVNAPIYDGREHFDEVTGGSYNPRFLLDYLSRHGVDPYPFVAGKGARAKRGWVAGRFGAGRLSEDHPSSRYATWSPRTAADVCAHVAGRAS